MQSSDEVAVSPGKAKPKQGKDNYAGKKLSPDGSRRLLLSPVKKLSALRLVSPIDSDQELNDLEVASVLAEGLYITKPRPCNILRFFMKNGSFQVSKCYFPYFCSNIDCGYTLEPPQVLTSTHNLCFLSENKKNITMFHLKITIFTAFKNRYILHGRVFVMH